MDFSVSQYAQLIIAALGGITYFLLLYRLPERTSLGFLILLVPFQVIDSRYGSLNSILIYGAAFAFLLQGRLAKVPWFGPILLILFAYMLAFTQSHPAARMQHVIYLIGFFSNMLLFYLVYNFLLRTQDWRFIMKLLLIMNVLVLIYCAIQFAAGPTRVTFGIEEFSLNAIRKDGRLVGPFKATAATAEYLTFQCLFLGYALINDPPKLLRRMVFVLLPLNFLFLIATGNRGGFITIVFGGLLFLFMYRRWLGFARIAKMLVTSATAFTAVAIVAVNFTDYGMLFERLEETEIEGGVPDTRALVWPLAWAEIVKKPVLGHGPKLAISTRSTQVADIEFVRYPHNLLLHVLYTTGIVGAFAWGAFFTLITARLYLLRNTIIDDIALAGLPRLGLVTTAVFFVSQLRIEFLREGLLDYQNYLFILFALFLATSDMLIVEVRNQRQAANFGRSPLKENVVAG